MFPTKCNFPERWSMSKLCTFCCQLETDEHVLNCCGYMDLHQNNIQAEIFMRTDVDMDELSSCARVLMKIYDRLLAINGDEEVVA